MTDADLAFVYFSPDVVAHKKLESITADMVANAFATTNVVVFTDSQELQNQLKKQDWENTNLLLMSSGNFDGVDLNAFAKELLK